MSESEPVKEYKRPTPVKALEALAKGRAIRAEQRKAEAEAKKELEKAKEKAVAMYGYGANNPPADYTKHFHELQQRLDDLSRKMERPAKREPIEDSSSSEEIIVRKKKPKAVPPAGHDHLKSLFMRR